MRIKGTPQFRFFRLALCCTLLVLSCAATAQAQDGTDKLSVMEVSGAVKVKLDDRWASPQVGMIVSLPATVSTGADGFIRISQGTTSISVAANTAIELFEGAEPGLPLQRVVQNRGSAFYDIAPQGSNRLRVETPYLVAVIKGTEFNVTVAAETSTVTLFEGRLQIEAPDVGDVVDLHEGQIARRHRDDPAITVLGMETSEPVSRRDAMPPTGGELPGSGDAGNGDAFSEGDSNPIVDTGDVLDGMPNLPPEELAGDIDPGDAGIDAHAEIVGLDDGGPGVGLDVDLDPGDAAVDLGLDTGLDLAGGDIDLGLDVGPALGDSGVDIDLDAGLELGDAVVDIDLDAGLELGDAVVDIDLDAGLDLDAGAVDLGLDSGIDLGDTAVDVGVDAGVDLDAGDIDLGLDGGIDLGGDATVDAGVDVGVDLDGTDLDAGLDAGIDLGDTSVDTGVDTGIDLDDGTIDVGVGVDVGDTGVDVGLDIDLGGGLEDLVDIDLGLDGDDTESDSETVEDDEADGLPLNPRDLLDLLGL
jgi:hypothetical protein